MFKVVRKKDEMINNNFKAIKPKCPRCNSMDTRADEKKSQLKCKRCGYPGHWRQFFDGQNARRKVQKLFKQEKLEGDPMIGGTGGGEID